ncbi:MAG TPA: acyl-CoA dehydrogenase [Frankiaceae bacterium]|nr:acyl-CoA dehydrogenase [Frankiaceae bacterium]
MALAVTEDQVALAESVSGWAERASLRHLARQQIDVPAENLATSRPPWWPGAVELGLMGLALPEEVGGSGATVVELAVAVEELGRQIAHGPFVASAVAGLALTVARRAAEDTKTIDALLERLAEGEASGAIALQASVAAADGPEGLELTGDAGLVLGLPGANWLLVPAKHGDTQIWAVVDIGEGVSVNPVDSLDVTRRVSRVALSAAHVPAARVLSGLDAGLVRDLYVTVAAAEAAGIARWAQETATAYAKVREQFGRPIGSFQSIKHLCADMLARSELAAAAAWDAAAAASEVVSGEASSSDRAQLELAAATAGAVALQDAVGNAKDCIQILGGIGFTWEHDAHLSLRRAMAMRALCGGTAFWNARVTAIGRSGLRRHRTIDLGTEADPLRRQVREVLAALPDEPKARRVALADAGLIAPHWPQPYGLSASPVEQLAVAEELVEAGVRPPDLVIGNWAVPTIMEHGNEEQRERFVRPTLIGEIAWCQLFSEPGAGSDLASLRTKATKVDGGWSLSGQKVWTSLARQADWGICLARSNPDAPHHKGITYFLVDMKSKGIDVRPLREITGDALFNEVFIDDVFVPEDCVVGPVDGGWRLARTTLANERVAMSSNTDIGGGLDGLLASSKPEPVLDDRMGSLVGGLQAAAALGLQITLRQLGGLDPGPSSSVRKLVGMYQVQDARELALEALGSGGADMSDPAASDAARSALSTRALTIAGGSSQVLRNVIAERLLGLPRD